MPIFESDLDFFLTALLRHVQNRKEIGFVLLLKLTFNCYVMGIM